MILSNKKSHQRLTDGYLYKFYQRHSMNDVCRINYVSSLSRRFFSHS
ncbi:TPA: hypothetical protein SMQ47_002776 [Proteus mirabilis]|nr:hypothetical protein [Proteus mirabilis]